VEQMPALSRIYKRLYEGLNYRARVFVGGRWAAHCRPVSIVFLLTELCNARCVHCDIWKNRGREDTPSVEQWKTVLSDLRRWLGRVQVTFSGGEALLRPFTTELVGHAAQLGLFTECLTHGYWDDQSTVERLAMARPWRVTVSLDGVGETHTLIRGRERFWEKTSTTLRTLQRVRSERRGRFIIRLKTVIMEQNLHDVANVARLAQEGGMEVFYQPIEQNYNTPEDSRWFESSPTWPKDSSRATAVVAQLIELKRRGLPIANSFRQLEAMIPYFKDPDALRVSTQAHHAHEGRALCAALTTLQFQANGDVTVCAGMPPVGNVKTTPIRQIWNRRPSWWETGCCIERRCTDHEKRELSLRE
jgi:MoaA/NifB/PqqE/SkfB family radical SAM enzyme